MNRTEQPRQGKTAGKSGQAAPSQAAPGQTASGQASGRKPSGQTRSQAGQGATRTLSAEQRHNMIAELAYRLAEQRGFGGDAALDDWFRAEAIINERLSGSR